MNPTPHYILSRSQYEAELAAEESRLAAEFGLTESDPIHKLEYPKPTTAAAVELRFRGIDVDAGVLAELAGRGIVTPPSQDERGLLWDRGHIEAVADYAVEQGWLTAGAQACRFLNISMAQERQALRKAAEMSHIGMNPDAYEIRILPGNPGKGIPATIEYWEPTRK